MEIPDKRKFSLTRAHTCVTIARTLQNFTTFVFDVGGTLLRLDLDKLAHAYVETAAVSGIALEFARIRAVMETLERELPQLVQQRAISLESDNGAEFWKFFYGEGFRRAGVTRDLTPAVDEIRARFQRGEFESLHADAIPALEMLKARGARLGIVSNFSPNCEDILRARGVHAYFDFFIVSAIAGVEKPDPKIFDLAVRAANTPREQMVYIGDSVYHDIQGAQRAQLAAILIDRADQHRDLNGARVRDLRELGKFLPKEQNANST